jgi:glycosyltransferase involved in cell wall biosynthesis
MRIAIVYLGRRGSGGPLSLSMAQALMDGAEVMAVVSENSESLAAWKESGVDHFVTPTYLNVVGALREWIHPTTIRLISQEIRKWKADIVFFPMFYTWNPLVQRQLKDIPSIVVVHDPIPHPDLAGYIYGILEGWSMRMAARIILFSKVFVPELVKKGFDPSIIDVIPHGDLTYYLRYAPAASITTHVDRTPTVLFFGRITTYKGLEILLQAYRIVQAQRKVAMIIAGNGNLGPYQKYLDGLVHVEIYNRWLEEVEIPGIFDRASMIVLPYTSGSQSGVLALAASFGLPVIASRSGGLVEQLEDRVTGLVIEPNSVEALSAAIISYLDDPLTAKKYGDNLRKKYSAHYNWEKLGKMILAICQKVS